MSTKQIDRFNPGVDRINLEGLAASFKGHGQRAYMELFKRRIPTAQEKNQFKDGVIELKVGKRALIARIKRELTKNGNLLVKCREGSRWHNEMGDYSIIDANTRTVVQLNVDLEKTGRELGVLRGYDILISN